jgi:signal transduction histidine kinase
VAELESFSYSVSHDLRAPLRSFDGYSAILLDEHADKLDDEARGLLGRMRAASQRMGQLIDDLLGLSRIGRAELQREEIDVSAMARSVVETLREAEPKRTVDVDIEPGIVADGDRRLVRLVLENLIGNAWKFTARRDGARIEIRQASPGPGQDEPGVGDAILVRDNGVGFDMTYADKLFGPFQRLHAASEFPGTGIGLATVRRILHRHGGWVRATATVDGGAAFTFSFSGRPLGGTDEEPDGGPASEPVAVDGQQPLSTRSDAWTT